MQDVRVVIDAVELTGAVFGVALVGWCFVAGVEVIRMGADWVRSKFIPWNL